MPTDGEGVRAVPRSMIFKRGDVDRTVLGLISDLRQTMMPYTAANLKERRSNTLKDFLSVAGPLAVTHFIWATQSAMGVNLRVARVPRGPTASFRLSSYVPGRAVLASQKRPPTVGEAYSYPPLVILNGFSEAATVPASASAKDAARCRAWGTIGTLLQNMFASIDVRRVKLAHCRRVVMWHLDAEAQEVHLRHYLIQAAPAALSRGVKKIVQAQLPDLSGYHDVADFVQAAARGAPIRRSASKPGDASKPGSSTLQPVPAAPAADAMSDSEFEDSTAQVELSDKYVGRGNAKDTRSAVRLKEVGPRLTLKLLKLEAGLSDGEVLYHSVISKTKAEVAALQDAHEAAAATKAARKAEQEANVARKAEAAAAKKARKEARRAARLEAAAEAARTAGAGHASDDSGLEYVSTDEEDSDAAESAEEAALFAEPDDDEDVEFDSDEEDASESAPSPEPAAGLAMPAAGKKRSRRVGGARA